MRILPLPKLHVSDSDTDSTFVSILGKLGTRITVAPERRWWQRAQWFVWRVEKTHGDHGSLMCFIGGGTFRKPEPDTVQGRCRNQGESWSRARLVVDDFQRQIAAHHNVQARTTTQSVPS